MNQQNIGIGSKAHYSIQCMRLTPEQWAAEIEKAGFSATSIEQLSPDEFQAVKSQIDWGGYAPVWNEEMDNLVVNTGLDDFLTNYWKGSAYTAAFYVGLTDGTPTPAAGDTMASHVGWAEMAGYDEATREVLTLGTVSGQSVDNSASVAEFTMDGTDTTIGGAFITTDSTKDGTAGTLISISAFTGGNRTGILDNDIIRVTVTITASSA